MIPLAISIVDRAFNINQRSVTFLQRLIIDLVIAGIVFGVLACYVSNLLGLVEALIAPALIWAIRSYRSVNRDNIGLLNGVNKTLSGARKQAEIEHRIKSEIRQRKQTGG